MYVHTYIYIYIYICVFGQGGGPLARDARDLLPEGRIEPACGCINCYCYTKNNNNSNNNNTINILLHRSLIIILVYNDKHANNNQ